jgi:hypothetical protein
MGAGSSTGSVLATCSETKLQRLLFLKLFNATKPHSAQLSLKRALAAADSNSDGLLAKDELLAACSSLGIAVRPHEALILTQRFRTQSEPSQAPELEAKLLLEFLHPMNCRNEPPTSQRAVFATAALPADSVSTAESSYQDEEPKLEKKGDVQASAAASELKAEVSTANEAMSDEFLRLQAGTAVGARHGGQKDWYAGEIKAVAEGQQLKYSVLYADGDQEHGVPRHRIRHLGQSAPQHQLMAKQGWRLEVGEEVDAQHGGGSKCFPASIKAVQEIESDGRVSYKYDLLYADGDTETAVAPALVHALVRPGSGPQFEFEDADLQWGGQEKVLSKYVGGGTGYLIGECNDFLLPVGVEMHATSRVKILREIARVKGAWVLAAALKATEGGGADAASAELYKRSWVEVSGGGQDDGAPSFQCMQCAVLSDTQAQQLLSQDEGGRPQPWLDWGARRWRIVEEIFTTGMHNHFSQQTRIYSDVYKAELTCPACPSMCCSTRVLTYPSICCRPGHRLYAGARSFCRFHDGSTGRCWFRWQIPTRLCIQEHTGDRG